MLEITETAAITHLADATGCCLVGVARVVGLKTAAEFGESQAILQHLAAPNLPPSGRVPGCRNECPLGPACLAVGPGPRKLRRDA